MENNKTETINNVINDVDNNVINDVSNNIGDIRQKRKYVKSTNPRKKRTGKWNLIEITDKERIKIMSRVRMRCYVMLKQLYKEEYRDLVNEEKNRVYEEMRKKKNIKDIKDIESIKDIRNIKDIKDIEDVKDVEDVRDIEDVEGVKC